MNILISNNAPSAEELAQLYLQAGFVEKADEAKMCRAVASDSQWYVARNEIGSLLGIGRLITDYARYGFIVDVIVEESLQRNGIGKAIMHKIIDKCHELKLDSVNLWPSQGKLLFYKQLGFIPLGNDQPLM